MAKLIQPILTLTHDCHASALADHAISTGHNIKWDHFEIIATGKSNLQCKIKETLLISELKPSLNENVGSEKLFFTITTEIHARSLANCYCQYLDRHINLKFMRRVSERERAIRQFVIVKNILMSVFNASVLLLTMNFVITSSKYSATLTMLWRNSWAKQDRRIKNWRQFVNFINFYR